MDGVSQVTSKGYHSTQELKKKLKNMQASMTTSKQICKLGNKKKRLEDLRRRIDLVLVVKESVPTIQMLLSSQDYGAALQLLKSVKDKIL